MPRFHSLSRMSLTLLLGVLAGLVLEAEGLKVWAERLEVGYLRSWALPLTQAWHGVVQDFGADVPRQALLELKSAWADTFDVRDEVLEREPEATTAVLSVPAVLRAPDPELLVRGKTEPAQAASAPPEARARSGASLSSHAVARPADKKPLLVAVPHGYTVALAGDSMMAVGLAPALRRNLDGAHIIKAYRSGTGLARPEVFDWLQKYPQMLGEARPRIVICSLGANDGQNVQVGKDVLVFGSPEWDAFYRGRLSAWLDLLTRDGSPVLWVGMPVMRAPGFARKMEHMNALVQDVLKAYPGVSWLDPNPVLAREQGGFAQYRADSRGKQIKLRQDDGIHMTDEGALFLLPGIRAWLEKLQPAAGTQASADPEVRSL